MRTLNYHHLRYLQAVDRSGNLTRTARELNLSQSALSAQIHKLEDHLEHKLFARQGRKLVRTEAGHIALAYAADIFGAGDALVAILTEQAPQEVRELRVGALATLSRNFQISFLRPLIGEDNVVIRLRSGRLEELQRAMEAYELDVVLTNQPPEPGTSARLIRREVAYELFYALTLRRRFPNRLVELLASQA